MKKIFISYRRAESLYVAGSLSRELRRRFGDAQVFRDRENLGGGVSWKRQVLEEISKDSALLVLISPDWSSATDHQGRRRLDLPDDPIRLEIADGLKDGAFVVPILTEDAVMPAALELPEDIRELADLHALQLRDAEWQHDVERISMLLLGHGFRLGGRKPGKGALTTSWVIGVFVALGLPSLNTMDRDGGWGLAFISALGLVFGLWSWRGQRWVISKAHWSQVGAVALSTVLGLIYTVVGLTGPPAPPASPTPEQPPMMNWNKALMLEGDDVGIESKFTCPPGGVPGRVWGTDVYASGSSLCSAAVHAGLLKASNGGVVRVRTLGPQSPFNGSLRNGVESSSTPSTQRAFEVLKP